MSTSQQITLTVQTMNLMNTMNVIKKEKTNQKLNLQVIYNRFPMETRFTRKLMK